MTRRRYPGDGLGPTSASVPRNRYIVCWKDPAQPEKGTVWFWCSPELVSHAQLSSDDGIPFRCLSYRPALLKARGINWTATWDDGTTFTFKASPQITKPLMAQLAQRWTVSPATLQRDKGRPFDLVTLLEHGHSHVYLVRLLTFDPTADGRAIVAWIARVSQDLLREDLKDYMSLPPAQQCQCRYSREPLIPLSALK